MSLVKKCRHPRADWDQCHCAWYADLRISGQRVYRNLGPDKRKARRAHDALADEVDMGVVPEVAGHTFEAMARAWLRAQQGRREKTLANYRIIVRHLTEWFGPEPVQRITQGAVLDFEADLWEREYAAGTIRNIRRALLAILQYAHAEGHREQAPKLPFIKDPAGSRVKHLSPPEARAVLAFAQPAHRFLYWTGLRAGELLGLRWDDVADGQVHVRRQFTQAGAVAVPKSRAAERVVDLADGAREALGCHRGGEGERIYPVGYHTLLRQWHSALEAAGFEQCGLHVLRHSNVALRLATDPPQDLMYIAEQLGHSSASFTLRVYGHLIRRPGRAAGLDAAFHALSTSEGRGKVSDQRSPRAAPARPRGTAG